MLLCKASYDVIAMLIDVDVTNLLCPDQTAYGIDTNVEPLARP